jgi:G3E family GTPase
LEAIVTTIDAVFAEAQLARHDETRDQVSFADRLVLTKTDLADPESVLRLREILRALNPVAPILEARNGMIDALSLFPAGFIDPDGPSSPALTRALFDAARAHPSHDAQDVLAISLATDTPLEWRAFDGWLRSLRIAHAERLLRVKGILDIASAHGPVVIQGVHHVVHAPVALESWPDDDRRSRIVLIVRGLPPGLIEESWNAALPSLRAGAARAA